MISFLQRNALFTQIRSPMILCASLLTTMLIAVFCAYIRPISVFTAGSWLWVPANRAEIELFRDDNRQHSSYRRIWLGGFGFSVFTLEAAIVGPPPSKDSYELLRAGFPLACLSGEIVDYKGRRATSCILPFNGTPIPLSPLVLGLVGDTACYTLIFASAALLYGRFRERSRMRGGMCPKCAYALKEPSTGCPECGWHRREYDTRE